jgi:hypothetical protein
VWGNSNTGGVNAPAGSGYTKIYSTSAAFAALKADGSITAWGSSSDGGSGAPSGNGYIKIYSTGHAFAALKADGYSMYYKTHQNYYSAQSDPPQQNATFLLFYLLFFASNLPIKPLEQVKIAWLML